VTWNGTTLTPTPKLPVPSGDSFGFPGAVSCPAVKSCVVFGSGPDPSASRGYPIIALFAETWNGSKWSFAATPLPAGEDPIIKSARCFSPTSCVLAGAIIPTNGPPSDRTPLLATWNGKTLTSMNPVVPAGFTQAEFQSVSCVTPTSCAAAGVDIKGTTESALNDESAFLDVTGGTGWNLTKWGGPSGTISTDLAGVSCVSRSNCVAAGQIATAKTSVAAALSWNGIKWSVTKVPGPGTGKVSIFYGISCPAAGNCTAVGETAKPTAGLGSQFAGHWNGSSWTLTAA
jgi:hypothetical protein